MPRRRKGAPGSFGAPLEHVLGRLQPVSGAVQIEVRERSAVKGDDDCPPDDLPCRIFKLNQRLFESGAKKMI